MRALAITSKGLEETAAKEIGELIKAKTKIKESTVIFHPKKMIDLCLLCYKSQSASTILLLFDYFRFENTPYKTIEKTINKLDITKWTDKNTTFAVRCKRTGDHGFLSSEIEKKTGGFIIKKIKGDKSNIKVNLECPDIIFYVYIYHNQCYLGVDFSGFDLSKREYKIFTHPTSLKGNIAYSLLRIIDYKKDKTLLDPFCSSGEIPIEAALFKTEFSVNHYKKNNFAFLKLKPFKKTNFGLFFKNIDKKIKNQGKIKIFGFDNLLKYIKSSQKNAKIAGINKHIVFSKISISWLDTKFNKGQIDNIVTQLPSYSQRTAKQAIDKIYNEFFYQSKYVLKDNGKILVLVKTEMPDEIPQKYNFELSQKKEIFSGKQKYNVFVYKKP